MNLYKMRKPNKFYILSISCSNLKIKIQLTFLSHTEDNTDEEIYTIFIRIRSNTVLECCFFQQDAENFGYDWKNPNIPKLGSLLSGTTGKCNQLKIV